MNALQQLPPGYRELLSIDLQKDKKLALLINGIALILGAVMVGLMQPFVSFFTLFDMTQGLLAYFLRFLVLLAGIILYMILHELVHGITMKAFGTQKVRYGFTGLYAFAGSDDFYNKKSYVVIALAPVLIWGVVLLLLNCIVPASYFWVVYFIQIANISGAAGDIYVTWKFSRLPQDILVQDNGVSMTVYSAQ